MILLSVSSLTSCGAIIRNYAPGGGNPDPDLKAIHMHTVHGNYTQEQFESHPDHDCNNTIFYGNNREN